MSSKTLEVTVIEGRNLNDTFDENGVYVELYLDEENKQRTTTMPNSSSVLWYEIFQFDSERKEDQLHIDVYDEDRIDRGVITSTQIELEKIRKAGGRLDEWIILPAHLGLRSHGEIRLILSLI